MIIPQLSKISLGRSTMPDCLCVMCMCMCGYECVYVCVCVGKGVRKSIPKYLKVITFCRHFFPMYISYNNQKKWLSIFVSFSHILYLLLLALFSVFIYFLYSLFNLGNHILLVCILKQTFIAGGRHSLLRLETIIFERSQKGFLLPKSTRVRCD